MIDYKKTKPGDEDFHRSRLMFIIRDEIIEYAPRGINKTHTEFFGDVTDIVRGFILNKKVYTYINAFKPVESSVIKESFKDTIYTLYAGTPDFGNYKYK